MIDQLNSITHYNYMNLLPALRGDSGMSFFNSLRGHLKSLHPRPISCQDNKRVMKTSIRPSTSKLKMPGPLT